MKEMDKPNDIGDLFKFIQKVKTMPRNMAPSRGLYPSGQYIKVGNMGYGKCPRNVYYENIYPDLEESIARLERMAFMGNLAETQLIKYVSKIGALVDSQYQLVDTEAFWSGKVDILTYGFEFTSFNRRSDVIIDHSILIPIELKTVYGYHGKLKCIVSNRNNPFEPKPNAVMQLALYVDFLQRKGYPIPYGIIWYVGRDDGECASHVLKIVSHDNSDGTVSRKIFVNGDWYYGFTIEGIVKENLKTKECIDAKTEPPRAFSLQYSQRKLEEMAQAGLLNKELSGKVQKGRFAKKGDIQCEWCNFKNKCHLSISEDEDDVVQKLYADDEGVYKCL